MQITKNIALVFVLLSGLAMWDTASAVTKKELKRELESRYQVTTRSLAGKVKRVGSVMIVRSDDLVISRLKLRMTPQEIRDGKNDSASSFADDINARTLRVGDRIYIYHIRVTNNGVHFQIAAETPSDVVHMNIRGDQTLQSVLLFQFPAPLEDLTANDVIQEIERSLVSENRLSELPDLMAAMESLRGQPIPMRQAVVAMNDKRARQGGEEDNGSSQEESSPAPTSTRTQPSQRAGNTKPKAGQSIKEIQQSISCDAARWEGLLTNVADLFECERIRAMQSLAGGRSLQFEPTEVEFSGGKLVATQRSVASWYSVMWERATRKGGMVEFNEKIRLRGNPPTYDVVCRFDAASMSKLREGQVNLVTGTLTDYRDSDYGGNKVIMSCDHQLAGDERVLGANGEQKTRLAREPNHGMTPESRAAISQVTEGLNLTGGAKAAVAEFYMDKRRLPKDNEEAGLARPEQIRGRYVRLVRVENGVVYVTFGASDGTVSKAIDGKSILLELVTSNGGTIEWNCRSENIENENLPLACRQ